MNEDVYNKIIEMCEIAINSVPKSKNHEELGLQMINQLSMIIGVCGGAKMAEKDNAKVEGGFGYPLLDDLLAELMEAIEKENKEEGVCGVRFHNNDGDERRLEDMNYGYELRFKKILGKYFV